MKWFKRHLNITLCLPILICCVATSFDAMISGDEATAFSVLATICYISFFILAIWVVEQKRRSIWWVIFPISVLLLNNKKELEGGIK